MKLLKSAPKINTEAYVITYLRWSTPRDEEIL
jgi:hypothetical protein